MAKLKYAAFNAAERIARDLARRVSGQQDFDPSPHPLHWARRKRPLRIETGTHIYEVMTHRLLQFKKRRSVLGRKLKPTYEGWYCVALYTPNMYFAADTLPFPVLPFPVSDCDLAVWMTLKASKLKALKLFPWHQQPTGLAAEFTWFA